MGAKKLAGVNNECTIYWVYRISLIFRMGGCRTVAATVNNIPIQHIIKFHIRHSSVERVYLEPRLMNIGGIDKRNGRCDREMLECAFVFGISMCEKYSVIYK